MNRSILALVLELRLPSLRAMFPCLLALTFFFSGAHAQETAAEASSAGGWVVIPIDQYRVLPAKAYPVEPDPEPPPLDATLTRIDYDLHVTGDLAGCTCDSMFWSRILADGA